MTRTILVTGAAGFIGSTLCERLVADGARVVGLDDFNDYYDPAIKRGNLAGLAASASFTLIEGDMLAPAAFEAALRAHGVEAVVHLAARAGVRPSVSSPSLYAETNVTGTARLLEACRDVGVDRLVIGSSSSVYGSDTPTPFDESTAACDPESPYAASKRAGELICKSFHHVRAPGGSPAHITCLRFFTVYGPRQRPEMAISRFTDLLLRGEPIPLFGDGSTRRDYTFVGDIVEGIVCALQRGDGFGIYNLGAGTPIRLDGLVGAIAKAVGCTPRIEYKPMQSGDVTVTWASTEAAARDLGFRASVSLDEGIRRYVAWHREHRAAAAGESA